MIHLHTHSHFSALDGLNSSDELAAVAQEVGFKALATTDHGVNFFDADRAGRKFRAVQDLPLPLPSPVLQSRLRVNDFVFTQ